MSIQKISSDLIETFTLATNPSRYYSSSSNGQVSGSVFVFARRSDSEKDVIPSRVFTDTVHTDANLDAMLSDIKQYVTGTAANITSRMASYMEHVNNQSVSPRKSKALNIIRFTPSVTLTSNTIRKNLVRTTLMPYYRTVYPTAHWAYTNYHSLNFFTASSVPTGSALLYPNVARVTSSAGQAYKGLYSLTGAFSFDFYVNPRYRPDQPYGDFKAGTLFHLSSSYAVSLVTGSQRDVNGYVTGFRMMLQLSHSADVAPSRANAGNYPNDLIFVSDDNSLQYNRWHHVIIKWGTNVVNKGTGSFIIDGNVRGNFVIPSSTVAPVRFEFPHSQPDMLVIGNYYEGPNVTGSGGNAQTATFFATNPATRDGLITLFADETGIETPVSFSFNHPLNAEVHDLAIKTEYMDDEMIYSSSGVGPRSIRDESIVFYLPPFFVKQSPRRRRVGTYGGVMQTPFFESNGTTDDPFNVAMSFGVGGHDINLENFVMDLAQRIHPRLHQLTASVVDVTTDARPANYFLFNQPFVRKRNLTIVPCDDGNFTPNFQLLSTGSSAADSFTDDLLTNDWSLISLNNLISTSTLRRAVTDETGSMTQHIAGASPENPGVDPGEVLTIFQRTRDNSSNEVVFFDISNLFYGNRIKPGTFTLKDSNLSGSDGKIVVTLRDDGFGNLYRADCLTSQSKWNNVGNLFYNEGIAVVKASNLPFFGKDQFEITFKGEQNIHVMKVNVHAPANQLNSSSNPVYMPVSASTLAYDTDKKFVHITGINFHDDSYNVVMKTKLAQPVLKRTGDELLVRCKFDF